MSFFRKLGQRKGLAKPNPGDYSSILGEEARAAQGGAYIDNDSDDGLLEKVHGTDTESASPYRPLWRNSRFLVAHTVLFAVYLFILSLAVNANPPKYPGLPFCT